MPRDSLRVRTADQHCTFGCSCSIAHLDATEALLRGRLGCSRAIGCRKSQCSQPIGYAPLLSDRFSVIDCSVTLQRVRSAEQANTYGSERPCSVSMTLSCCRSAHTFLVLHFLTNIACRSRHAPRPTLERCSADLPLRSVFALRVVSCS